MIKRLLFVTLILFVSVVSAAKEIPLEDFAAKSAIKSAKLSPDGKHLAFTFEEGSEIKLGIMDMKTKKGTFSFDVGKNRGVARFWWGNNKRVVFISQRITGWLDGKRTYPEMKAVNIDGKRAKMLFDFQSSNLRPLSRLEDDPDHFLVGKWHFQDKGAVKMQRLNINTGKMTYVAGAPNPVGSRDSRIRSISVDLEDNPRVAMEVDPMDRHDFRDDIYRIHYKKTKDSPWQVLKLEVNREGKPDVGVLGFNRDSSVLYFSSNHDLKDKGTLGLFSLDFATGEIKKIFRHPDVDVMGAVRGRHGEVIGVRYEAGYPDYFYLDNDEVKDEVAFHRSMRASFKGELVSLGTYTKDLKQTTVFVRSDKNPGDFYLLDRDTNKVTFLASSHPKIKPKQMSAVEPFTLTARDGLKMYGLLTIPKGKELKNLPMVVYPHGGPYGPRDYWGWDNRAQLMAHYGYLVLQLDFRGSGGYGTKFQEAGYSEWGNKMQDDLTDATLWAIKQGYADKDRICIHGVSYGGYASMQAVVKEPDLYKCSIPDAGPYELDYQMKKSDSFEGGHTKERKRFIEQMLGKDYEQVNKEVSPVYHVDKLKAALLIVHGKEDVRVPIGNAYLLEKKLKEQGIKYKTLYKKDGHGFQKIPNRVALYKAMLKFLDKHIGDKK